jgi:hypothetical protein
MMKKKEEFKEEQLLFEDDLFDECDDIFIETDIKKPFP